MGSDSKSPLPVGSSSWIRSELDKKADEKWVEAKLQPAESTAKEAKTIALASKRDWGKIRLGGVVTLVVLVLSGAAQYFALKENVKDNREDLAEVKDEVVVVASEVKKVKAIVEDDRKRQDKKDKKQLEQIKSVIKDTLHEVRADIQPEPPRRRNR